MRCDFCFIPFDRKGCGNLRLWLKIINRCKEWHPRSITFGGGDPFAYNEFPLLLKKLIQEKLFLQVDTNCLGLKDQHLSILKQVVKLISVPLEGPKPVHTAMRNDSNHFDLIIKWIKKLTKEKIGVKVNTVVTEFNLKYLDNLAKILREFPIKAWSLYQFWPIGWGKHYRRKFELKIKDFLLITSKIKEKYDFTDIEISTISDRWSSYFLISSVGRIYGINKLNFEEYIEFGDVFEENIILKWRKHGDPKAILKRSNLRIALITD